MPFTGPVLQVAKEEMNTLMGFFRFNFGLVLQVVETLYESRNRLKRIRDRGSFDKFSVDKDKSEAKNNGKLRSEGKDYIVQDGDIMNFRFNV